MPVRVVSLSQPPRRIALIKPSALGDILNSLPVLSALRERFPESHLTWVVNRAYEPLLRGHPHLDAVLPFDRGALRRGVIAGGLAFARFLGSLRRHDFDLAIDLQGLLRSGLMTRATGAPVRLGLATAREGARLFYTHRIDDIRGVSHAVDRCWRVAEALGAQGPKQFVMPVADDARRWANDVLRSWPRPWLAAAPGSRWLTKRWPPGHFAALLRQARARFGGTVVFIGAPDEAELAREAAELLDGPACNLAGTTTLPQLAAVLESADVLLSNDSGPMHLAVALGRPVVAPYTCTRVALNGPYGQFDRAVETGVWCAGSYRKRCGRLDCMRELTPDRLWPVLHEVLLTWERQRRSA
jgi:lipopolysaccharide heptosyltransferase II